LDGRGKVNVKICGRTMTIAGQRKNPSRLGGPNSFCRETKFMYSQVGGNSVRKKRWSVPNLETIRLTNGANATATYETHKERKGERSRSKEKK